MCATNREVIGVFAAFQLLAGNHTEFRGSWIAHCVALFAQTPPYAPSELITMSQVREVRPEDG